MKEFTKESNDKSRKTSFFILSDDESEAPEGFVKAPDQPHINCSSTNRKKYPLIAAQLPPSKRNKNEVFDLSNNPVSPWASSQSGQENRQDKHKSRFNRDRGPRRGNVGISVPVETSATTTFNQSSAQTIGSSVVQQLEGASFGFSSASDLFHSALPSPSIASTSSIASTTRDETVASPRGETVTGANLLIHVVNNVPPVEAAVVSVILSPQSAARKALMREMFGDDESI
jgi:hypothetical protein